jgi:hypothetical protein
MKLRLCRDESKIYYPSRSESFFVIEVSVHREITSIQSDILILVDRIDPEAVELTYSDMKCLEPEEYLKSPVINFCLQ